MIAIQEALNSKLFTKNNIVKNIIAGLIVGVVALPLAMAFAIASGARPENGLYTSIIAGLFVGVFGGSRVQIAGPTGAFIVILASITGRYGFTGLQIATVLAGIILLLMGIMRFGSVIKFIPEPVIAGFTAGIGVIIFVGEWKDFFGLNVHLGLDDKFHHKFYVLIKSFSSLNIETTILAIISLLLVMYTHKIKIFKKIPGPLFAMVVATVIQAVFNYKNVATLGSVFGVIPRGFPPLTVPNISFGMFVELLAPAFTIALLGAIESLLSASAADGLANTKHNPNQELIGQGLANFFTPFFGGFAATGAIARTATNIKNGGNMPLAAIIHSVFLLAVILFLAPLAQYVPLCSLAAILFVVSYNMSDIPHFKYILKHSRNDDKIVLLSTFTLTIFSNLVVAVNIGIVLAVLFFMRRITKTTNIQQQVYNGVLSTVDKKEDGSNIQDKTEIENTEVANSFKRKVIVYTINGPLFFAITEKFAETLSITHSDVNAVVFNFSAVPFIDYSGLNSFQETIERLAKQQIIVYICGANETITKKFQEVKIFEQIAENKSFNSIDEIIQIDNLKNK